MTDPVQLPAQERVYGSLASMLRKYDRYARQDAFRGSTPEEFRQWREDTRSLLHSLLGTCKMERGIQDARRMETVFTEEGIRREHWRIQVEPEVWMTLFLLAPAGAGKDTPVILCPPGHNGAGKYSVAGVRDYPPITEKIDHYHYDYGLQLAKQGCVTVCPDCRGFGERREDPEDTRRLPEGLKGDCYRLAHMGEPLGIPVLGMLTWQDSSTGWKRTGASTQTVWGPWGFPAAGCRRCGWRRWTTG